MSNFSIEQVSTICGVSPEVALEWFTRTRKNLRGYHRPGTGEIVIPREYLLRFINEEPLELQQLNLEGSRLAMVLLVSPSRSLFRDLKHFAPKGGFLLAHALTLSHAKSCVQSLKPHCVIFDLGIKGIEEFCMNLKQEEAQQETLAILLYSSDATLSKSLGRIADGQFRLPVNPDFLSCRLGSLFTTRLNK